MCVCVCYADMQAESWLSLPCVCVRVPFELLVYLLYINYQLDALIIIYS